MLSLFRVFKNPFAIYIVAFASVLLLYQVGWSEIYPNLTAPLLLFFAATFMVAAVLARSVSPLVEGTGKYTPGLLPAWSWMCVAGTFAIEMYMMGGFPLFLVMGGANFYAMEASATHLHVFTLWSVFATIRFADFLYSDNRPRYLFEASLPIIFYTLMIYRGPAIMTLASWAFLTMIRFNGLRPRYLAVIFAATVAVIYINGSLGDIRSPGQETAGAPSASLKAASQELPQPLASAPRKLFWGYLYLTVPMANFQNAIDKAHGQNGSVTEFILSELVPDTFSRRILPLLNERIESNRGSFVTRDQLYTWQLPLVAPGLNTSTLFGRAYGYFGWAGPVIMFTVLATFAVAYLSVIIRSPYCVPALALLNTLVLFCVINNMLASAAMIPQLVWPLLLPPWGWIRGAAADLTRRVLLATFVLFISAAAFLMLYPAVPGEPPMSNAW